VTGNGHLCHEPEPFWWLSTFQLVRVLPATNLHPEQLNKNTITYFNFAESKEKRSRGKHNTREPSRRGPYTWTTSEEEYEVDA
jgi:hypothetical protein